jgi:hypothetical protein
MKNAIQVFEHVETADQAADLSMALMSLEGFIGGRVYEAQGIRYSRELGALAMHTSGWNVQMFFKPGTMVGRPVVLLDSFMKQIGVTA